MMHPLFMSNDLSRQLKESVGTQEDEYAIAKEQAYRTYDKTYLNHILLLDETSSICQCIGRSTDGEYHTY